MKTGKHWILILAVIIAAEIAGSLETTLTFAALPAAIKEIGRPAEVSWLITGYLLVAGASAAVCGRLGDLFGRSRVLMTVLGLAATGSILSALSSHLLWIIAGRSIQGLAGAILPLGYGLVREYLPAEKVALGTGIITGAASLGAALGFVFGGMIVDTGHWQHVFVWSAIIALAVLAICWPSFPHPRTKRFHKAPDLFGGILFAPSVASVLLAVTILRMDGFSDLPVLLLAAGVLGLVIWVQYERRHPNPLIDVRLLAVPEIALANLAGAAVAMGAYQILMVFPLLMQQPVWTGIGFGITATLTGILKLPSNLAAVAGASSSGVIAKRFGGRVVVLIGTAMCVVGWSGLLFDISHLWFVIVTLSFSSAGATIVLAGVANVIMESVSLDRTSEATGMTIVVRMVAQAFGSLIVGTLMAQSVVIAPSPQTGTFPAASAFMNTVIYIVLVSALGVVASLVLCRRGPRRVLRAFESNS